MYLQKKKTFDAQEELEKIKSSSCNKCKENETKIVELNQVIRSQWFGRSAQ